MFLFELQTIKSMLSSWVVSMSSRQLSPLGLFGTGYLSTFVLRPTRLGKVAKWEANWVDIVFN
ncbi:unnamed protein product, partial [marine sediment metagenome]